MADDRDAIHWHAHATIHKYTADDERKALILVEQEHIPISVALARVAVPYETIEDDGNLMTRLGRKRLMDRLFGTASNQALDATHCRIGVGNSSTAAVDTDTDLGAAAGSANRQFNIVDSAPVVGTGASSGQITLVSTFLSAVANFIWNEWGVDGGTVSGVTVTADTNTTPGLINHKINTGLGTKSAAGAWVFTVTITVT